MSFPKYSTYKESGAERFGNVPEHWAIVRLKDLLLRRITDGPHTTPVFEDDGVPFLSVDGIQDGELCFDGCRFISPSDHQEYRKKALPRRDDLLMGKAASTGKIARVKVDFEFSIWSPLALIRVDPATTWPAFVEYALKCPIAQAQIDDLCTSNTQKNISMDDIPRLMLARPPLSEQVSIATFLDHEIAKIHALVEEQRRLIELLKEKRQAVISQAVTKGLSPNVPMVDSGVEWLGKVPAHWEVGPLRRAFSAMDYGISDSLNTEGDVAVLRMGNIGGGKVNMEDVKYVPCVDPSLLLERGDLLFNRTNSLDQIGKVGLFQGSEEMVSFASYLVRLRTRPSCVPEFFGYLLNSVGVLAQARCNAIVAIGQCNLNPTRYGAFTIAVPPRAEQVEISGFLDAACAEIDQLVQAAEDAGALLGERRSALISAAVTGKIDVRGLLPHPEAVAA